MPSTALQAWTLTQLPQLQALNIHCAQLATAVPLNQSLADAIVAGYVMLVSGHFQRFLRDLDTECVQAFIAPLPKRRQFIVQELFTSETPYKANNPRWSAIVAAVRRFDLELDLRTLGEVVQRDATTLGHLNHWRNHAAHQLPAAALPEGVPAMTLALVEAAMQSCDRLAHFLVEAMYNHLRRLLRKPPW